MDGWMNVQNIIAFAFTSYHDDYIHLILQLILIISAYIMREVENDRFISTGHVIPTFLALNQNHYTQRILEQTDC